MTTVNPAIAKLAIELAEAWDDILTRHFNADGDLEFYAPFGLRLYTIDGYTVDFLEEGIEFYPKEEV